MKGKIYRLKGKEGQAFFLPSNSKDDDYDQMVNRATLWKNPELYEEVKINGLGMEVTG